MQFSTSEHIEEHQCSVLPEIVVPDISTSREPALINRPFNHLSGNRKDIKTRGAAPSSENIKGIADRIADNIGHRIVAPSSGKRKGIVAQVADAEILPVSIPSITFDSPSSDEEDSKFNKENLNNLTSDVRTEGGSDEEELSSDQEESNSDEEEFNKENLNNLKNLPEFEEFKRTEFNKENLNNLKNLPEFEDFKAEAEAEALWNDKMNPFNDKHDEAYLNNEDSSRNYKKIKKVVKVLEKENEKENDAVITELIKKENENQDRLESRRLQKKVNDEVIVRGIKKENDQNRDLFKSRRLHVADEIARANKIFDKESAEATKNMDIKKAFAKNKKLLKEIENKSKQIDDDEWSYEEQLFKKKLNKKKEKHHDDSMRDYGYVQKLSKEEEESMEKRVRYEIKRARELVEEMKANRPN